MRGRAAGPAAGRDGADDAGAGFRDFDLSLDEAGLHPLTATGVTTLQLNVGSRCNLSCRHCHVEAGPAGGEVMGRATMDACLEAVGQSPGVTVDITGGAPEMNPNYRYLVEGCVRAGGRVMTRTNLAIFTEDGYDGLPRFLAERGVEVVASLPYYLEGPTDRMRGAGAFRASVEALRVLNGLGYGAPGTGLILNLVYNPCGAYLSPPETAMEKDYKRELRARHGTFFNSLYAITNMPVGRFRAFLEDSGNFVPYMDRLVSSFNGAAAGNVMCRSTLNVGPDGSLHDCDFNRALGLGLKGGPVGIGDYAGSAGVRERISEREIKTALHCYGCTAGAGSSCTGEVAAPAVNE